jgi:N-acetylglucosaminyldiphosphoundecaprenol N-acetyl-beta-D-mannosaminyltransferase
MQRDCVVILGIPIDSLTLDQAIDKIVEMVADYRQDGIPRQVATVNVDFIVQTLGKELGQIRHAELLDILRRADLVTADGMPIVWLSRLLDNPLPERVTGADMVPALAARAAREGLSLFLLGGQADSANRAAEMLKQRNPDIKIAGILSPMVYTEGDHLEFFEETDAAIVAEVNAAAPDILLIAFGNPKQELWFRRNVTRLKVPVSIGIGGTFAFITGDVSRAPKAMQELGLEWLWRLAVEPLRLWRRYLKAFTTFGVQLWPAVMDYRRQRKEMKRRMPHIQESAPVEEQTAYQTDSPILHIPTRLDALAVRKLRTETGNIWQDRSALILDFTPVAFVDSSGLGFVIEMWRMALKLDKVLVVAGMSSDVRRTFALSRLNDLISDKNFDELEQAVQYLDEFTATRPKSVAYKKDGTAIITIIERLDAFSLKGYDISAIIDAVSGRDCIFDLRKLMLVDSSGLVLFIRIQRAVMAHGHTCMLCAPTELVRQMLRLTRLEYLFTITDDISMLNR